MVRYTPCKTEGCNHPKSHHHERNIYDNNKKSRKIIGTCRYECDWYGCPCKKYTSG